MEHERNDGTGEQRANHAIAAMTPSEIARRLGLGRLALALYHRPAGLIRHSLRNGGPFAQWETERQRREMEVAAERLGPLPENPGSAVTLHLMTGRRFWYQTAFCLHSFARAAKVTVHAELYDDGTIDRECMERLARLGPSVRVHRLSELQERRERHLPERDFPVLTERWHRYLNIRKLIDVHLASSGWKLVIDSDLLFFRRPDLLLDWLAQPAMALVAEDCVESYGYTRGVIEEVAGSPVPERVNVGLCGLCSHTIEWEQLERWTSELQRREKTNYYLEQALVAMMVVRQPFVAAPAADYITLPTREQVLRAEGVMHHYVAASKRWYFRHGWRHTASAAPT